MNSKNSETKENLAAEEATGRTPRNTANTGGDNPPPTISAGTVDEVRAGVRVVRGHDHNIAVFADGDSFYAVDNRCPHMGFPLDRGTVQDGMLTCHWHQARFDLASGCTFDLWADDVLRFGVTVAEGEVFVDAQPANQPTAAFHMARLRRGLAHDVGLVQAKSLLALLEAGVGVTEICSEVVRFAGEHLNRWSEGLTRLGCVLNLHPYLDADVTYEALYYATRQLGAETAQSVPHRAIPALEGASYELATLDRWLRRWVMTRHREGAERTLRAGAGLLPSDEFSGLLVTAATERLYADGGHLLEDCNKVMELASHLGSETAESLVPLLVDRLTGARGQEESTNWHHPVALAAPLLALEADLAQIRLDTNKGELNGELTAVLLGDDPLVLIEQMKVALRDGASPVSLAREVAYAAALRLARFATSNEVTDWFNPQHTFINANAAYQSVTRSSAPGAVRAVFHAAVSVYMDRFLNVPPAKLPEERGAGGTVQSELAAMLALLDQRGNLDDVADAVTRHIHAGGPFDELVNCLVRATVREDLDFHSLQVLDAAVNQCRAWGEGSQQTHIMVGVVRNLAAHCPTRRAGEQTARIARKLQRGELIYQG